MMVHMAAAHLKTQVWPSQNVIIKLLNIYNLFVLTGTQYLEQGVRP